MKAGDIMKLESKTYYFNDEYCCELTRELDKLAKLPTDSLFHHYILADDYCIKHKNLAIRVPGGTVGGIVINDDNIITKIAIDINYVVKTYPHNVEEIIESKYLGQVIEF